MTESAKKVLIFSIAYYPHFIGGAEVAVKEITDRLVDDFEFHMITLGAKGDKSDERISNVFVHRVGSVSTISKYLFPFIGFFKAVDLHKKHHFQITWSIMANYAGFAGLFFKYLKPEVTSVLTLQEGDPILYIKKRVGVLYPLFKKIFTKADRIHAISNYLADLARDMGAKGRVDVVPNGVDISLFSKAISDDEKNSLARELGKKTEDIFLITTSRLVIKNGVGDIIKSLQYLPTNVKLLIVGNGVLEDTLKASVDAHKLSGRVLFVGFIHHADLPKYLAISDIFVRPSLSEGMGNSFIEAMSAGIPVVATPVGGIVDFLVDRETGLFCQVSDPKSIAECVKLLLSDKMLSTRLVENAQKMVLNNYDWSRIAILMREVIR